MSVGVKRCSHHNIRVAVSVYIACGSNTSAVRRTQLISLPRPRSCRGEPRCRAYIERGPTLARLSVVIQGGPHHNIGIAVPVYIAGSREAGTVIGISLICLSYPRSGGGESRGRACVQRNPTFVGFSVVIIRGLYHYIRVPIAIHIPSSREVGTKVCTRLIGLARPRRNGGEPRARAKVKQCSPLIGLSIIVIECPHNKIREPVAVYVSGCRNAVAVIGINLIGLPSPRSCGQEPECRA